MTKKLSGKVALVTGGSRGIGAASARALADEGANVAISYVASPDKAEAVVRELKAKGVEARAFKADQASSTEVEQLVNDVAKTFGRLDILVNNAGVAVSGAVDDATADTAALARQDAINVHGVVAAIRTASKLMGEGGRIVTIGSGIATRASFPGLADYAATKAAIVGYSKGASRDLGSPASRECAAAGLDRHRYESEDGGEFAEAQQAARATALRHGGRDRAGVVFLTSAELLRDRHGAQCRWRLRRLIKQSSAAGCRAHAAP
jgi:NAD(P)-dependent dehydrogenase (short-subunit alcohol dehydrogenase family)